jgi:hypothetical protein
LIGSWLKSSNDRRFCHIFEPQINVDERRYRLHLVFLTSRDPLERFLGEAREVKEDVTLTGRHADASQRAALDRPGVFRIPLDPLNPFYPWPVMTSEVSSLNLPQLPLETVQGRHV